jgi:hypothetical protein
MQSKIGAKEQIGLWRKDDYDANVKVIDVGY